VSWDRKPRKNQCTQGHGTPRGRRTRGQKTIPRAISTPRTQKYLLLLPWPAMRAHPPWQRPLYSMSRLTCCTLPRLFKSAHLLDLIIIEINPIIISAADSSSRSRRRLQPSSLQTRSERNPNSLAISLALEPEAKQRGRSAQHNNKILRSETNRCRSNSSYTRICCTSRAQIHSLPARFKP